MLAKHWMLLAALLLVALLPAIPGRGESPAAESAEKPSVDEARKRAALLHDMTHATLQIVHHEYYREDEGLAIPAETLKRMFREVEKRQQVELRWLVVDGEAMNADHKPQNDFERAAAAALAAGKESHEQVAGGLYRRAGAITLRSECQKCHIPNRKSTADRTAGLIISVPVRE